MPFVVSYMGPLALCRDVIWRLGALNLVSLENTARLRLGVDCVKGWSHLLSKTVSAAFCKEIANSVCFNTTLLGTAPKKVRCEN